MANNRTIEILGPFVGAAKGNSNKDLDDIRWLSNNIDWLFQVAIPRLLLECRIYSRLSQCKATDFLLSYYRK